MLARKYWIREGQVDLIRLNLRQGVFDAAWRIRRRGNGQRDFDRTEMIAHLILNAETQRNRAPMVWKEEHRTATGLLAPGN